MQTILVVDDSQTNLQMIRSVLGHQYVLLLAVSGEMALRYAEKKAVDLVLLDLAMPGMDGRETLLALRALPSCASVPIIFLTASRDQTVEVECLRLGACDFITKPFAPEVLTTRIARVMELEGYRQDLMGKLQEKTQELETVVLQSITAIAAALDAKDEYTKGHSERVAYYADALALGLGWAERERVALQRVALLHDVGKIGVPDALLNKPAPLSDDEFEIFKQHTTIGGNILRSLTSAGDISLGACAHHERYDGKGYPLGIGGESIPDVARIICIADAYDAMTTDRCYRPRLPLEDAKNRLLQGARTQFDPDLVQLFAQLLEESRIITEGYEA